MDYTYVKKVKKRRRLGGPFWRYDVDAVAFFELEWRTLPLEVIKNRIRGIKKAIRDISDRLMTTFEEATSYPLPVSVALILLELDENLKSINQPLRDFIEASVRIYVLKLYLRSKGKDLSPKYEENILHTFMRTLSIELSSSSSPSLEEKKYMKKDKEKIIEEEEEEEEELNLIIPYKGPLNPNEIEPDYPDMIKGGNKYIGRSGNYIGGSNTQSNVMDADSALEELDSMNLIYSMLDIDTYQKKLGNKIRKQFKKIIIERHHALEAYAIRVWNLMSVKRSKLDKQRMERYHQYFRSYGKENVFNRRLRIIEFVANLDAKNLRNDPPPGYYSWFLNHANRSGTLVAVRKLWIRNNILLSNPQILMLMHHQLLHMYPSQKSHKMLRKPFARMAGENLQITMRALGQDELHGIRVSPGAALTGMFRPLVIIRLRSDFDHIHRDTPQKLLVADRFHIQGNRISKWRLDQNDIMNELFNMGTPLNQADTKFEFLIADGGNRMGHIPVQPIPDYATPFLGIIWVTDHLMRLGYWQAWAQDDPDYEERFKQMTVRRWRQ